MSTRSTLPYTVRTARGGNLVSANPETLGDPKRDYRWVTSRNVKVRDPYFGNGERTYHVRRCYDLRERTPEGKARVISKVYDRASAESWILGGHAMLGSVAFGGVDL